MIDVEQIQSRAREAAITACFLSIKLQQTANYSREVTLKMTMELAKQDLEKVNREFQAIMDCLPGTHAAKPTIVE